MTYIVNANRNNRNNRPNPKDTIPEWLKKLWFNYVNTDKDRWPLKRTQNFLKFADGCDKIGRKIEDVDNILGWKVDQKGGYKK